MSQLLEKQQLQTEHLPMFFRNRTLDYTLLVVGALVAGFGAYTYFVPARLSVASTKLVTAPAVQ